MHFVKSCLHGKFKQLCWSVQLGGGGGKELSGKVRWVQGCAAENSSLFCPLGYVIAPYSFEKMVFISGALKKNFRL